MNDSFDPAMHRMTAQKRFEDFAVGEEFALPSRTLTDAMFTLFQAVSGDNHPIHYDRNYCRARGHDDMLAHGFLILIQSSAGAGLMPHLAGDALVGFIEQSSRFLKPVYAGDTLYPKLVISELTPQRTTGVMTLDMTIHNQKGELVLDGWHRYLLRLDVVEV